ncbi:MAG: efflux RND transporter permease subunit [Clostridium sp.]|nr:efflux RND transporter permease subunit [Clostridium sp.]
MIAYLLRHPISVFVSYATVFLLSCIAYTRLPTSLLPDIPIPEVVVQTTGDNLSAEEMERVVVKPLRQRLMQTSHLSDLRSEARDGSGQITLQFDYGTRMDLAFVEVNEKVDAAMNALPKDVSRPQVVKVNATDLPVFDLVMTLRDDRPGEPTDEMDFMQMCELTRNTLRRRLEQLPEVSMADLSGLWEKELFISIDREAAAALGLTESDVEKVFKENNIETGNATVRDGEFEFNVRFSSSLRTAEDVENLYLRHGQRMLQLKDIARTEFRRARLRGEVFHNGKRAVVMSVIKHPDVKMDDLQQSIAQTVDAFGRQFPKIDFHIAHDQSELLDVTMGSLRQSLVLGLLLIFLITSFFLRDVRMPVLIGATMLVSLVISMGLFYLAGLSLNIVSLVGLILSVGMMIDNAIIVTDDINQYRQAGLDIDAACTRGTTEVITPMLSSMLTTVAVFLPLIFMSGIAGAVFYDQALAITLSLGVSYVTAITFLPVLCKLMFRRQKGGAAESAPTRMLRGYEWTINSTFAHRRAVCVAVACTLPLCYVLFRTISVEKMPFITHHEAVVHVDWNENIHPDENTRRTGELAAALDSISDDCLVLTGQQQFLIGNKRRLNVAEAKLYVNVPEGEAQERTHRTVDSFMKAHYPQAVWTLSPPETVFEDLFSTSLPDLTIELAPGDGQWDVTADSLTRLARQVKQRTGAAVGLPPYSTQIHVALDYEKMITYEVEPDAVVQALKNAMGENRFATLHDYEQYIPVQTEREGQSLEHILHHTFVQSKGGGAQFPLHEFASLSAQTAPQAMVAGTGGRFIPLQLERLAHGARQEESVRHLMREHGEWSTRLSGAYYQNREMMDDLLMILLVSVVMMYLILTAQFESFLQPLILLVEIPIDVAAALLCLMAFGYTLNLMSAIGIVVTCGVIVNDSILKINVINELRAGGMALMPAIHEAGRKRLRSIVMTSLTSVFALVPILFGHDMGSELQKPFAIAMIGAMVVGTLVSLFVIPLLYALIYKDKKQPAHETNPA